LSHRPNFQSVVKFRSQVAMTLEAVKLYVTLVTAKGHEVKVVAIQYLLVLSIIYNILQYLVCFHSSLCSKFTNGEYTKGSVV
jgi:hypothetical protein